MLFNLLEKRDSKLPKADMLCYEKKLELARKPAN